MHGRIYDFASIFFFFGLFFMNNDFLRDWCVNFQLLGDCCSTFLPVRVGYHITV